MRHLGIRLDTSCGCNCKFCYLNTMPAIRANATASIQRAIDLLDLYEYEELTLTGGDVLNAYDQSDFTINLVRTLFLKINDKIESGALKKVNLESSLIRSPQEVFSADDIINIFSDKSKLCIVTSYDVAGRFSEEMLESWKSEVQRLKKKYQIDMRVSIIMTQALIDALRFGTLRLESLRALGSNDIRFLLPTCGYDSNDFDSDFVRKKDFDEELGFRFFPRRDDFLQILPVIEEQLGLEAVKSMFSKELNPDVLIYRLENKEIVYPFYSDDNIGTFLSTIDMDNGYIDSNKSMRQDVLDYVKSKQ